MRLSIILLLLALAIPFIPAIKGAGNGNGKGNGNVQKKRPSPPPGLQKRVFLPEASSTNSSSQLPSGSEGNVAKKAAHVPLNPSEARKKIFDKINPNASAEEVEKQTKHLEQLKARLEEKNEAAKKKAASAPQPPKMDDKLAEQMRMMAEEMKISKEKGRQRGDEPIRDILELNEDLKEYMFQGDILLTADEVEALLENGDELAGKSATNFGAANSSGTVLRAKRGSLNFVNYPSYKWDKTQPIGYTFASDVDSMRISQIKKAIQLWSDNTCLSFVQSSAPAQQILFQKGPAGAGCYTYGMGKNSDGSVNFINLDDGCTSVGIIAHEIGHRLAFFHTQMRYDRAQFVDVYLANTYQPGQYSIQSSTTNNNYQITYDYGSVMHYRYDSFSNSTSPVMVAKEPYNQNTMGQRVSPAFSDYLMMNRAYSCQDSCPTGSSGTAVCKNGGFPAPKNCSKCICPAGFGDTLCDQRQPDTANAQCTGSIITATTDWQLLEATVSSPSSSFTLTNPYEACHWQIVPPQPNAGYWIDLYIEEVANANDWSCQTGCPISSVEFKVGAKDRSGLRMCCQSDLGTDGYVQVTAQDGLAVVNAYSAAGSKTFRVWYIAY